MIAEPKRLMNRNFLLLWQGQVVSQIGTQLFLVIVILALKQATESPTLVGLFMMAYTIPAVLLGPLGGAMVDRYSRRAVLVTGDFLRGISLISIASVLWLSPHLVGVIVVSFFVYSVVEGTVGAVWLPASMSVVPDLVPAKNLTSANSFLQGSFQICTVVAQACAGILFRILGTPLLTLIDGFTYIYAAASDFLVHIPKLPPRPVVAGGRFSAFKAEIMEGLRHIHARAGMRILFYTMAFFQVLMVPMLILFPFYVDRCLHAGPQWYGLLLAASGLGTVVGYGLGGAVKLRPTLSSWITVSAMVLMSLSLALLALVTNRWTAMWIIGGIGAMDGFIGVKLLTALQLATPTEVRGRVFGVLMTITRGLVPLAMGLTGFVAEVTNRNIPLIYLVCGGACAVLAVNIAARLECRDFLAGKDAPMPLKVAA
ncbi:MAG TPA: MFS transporter [Candidatus Angelobacter sp.]|nr:MFS transporter [Candidatus Angelobacter sp.]